MVIRHHMFVLSTLQVLGETIRGAKNECTKRKKICSPRLLSLCAASRMWVRHRSYICIYIYIYICVCMKIYIDIWIYIDIFMYI